MQQQYHGSCHCGAIKFSFASLQIERGLRCNCSICRRKGALMSDFVLADAELIRDIAPDSLGLYQFGDGRAKHYFCRQCGIYPFHETMRKPGYYRVNLGCLDEVENLFELSVSVFDGKSL